MKILLTGVAGFIGFHLAESLLQDDFEVLGIDNLNDYYDQEIKRSRLNILKSYKNFIFNKVDISDKLSIIKIFKSFKPKKVIHLAAQVGVRYSISNPLDYIETNINGYLNIIEQCSNYNVENFVYASSSSVYGKNNNLPYCENYKSDKPLSIYAATKKSNELIAYSYSKLYGLNTTGLRYFTTYGPWYRPDMAIFIFIKNIFNNTPIQIFNNGNMSRDFTHINDIVNGTISALNKNYNYEIFNLGSNKGINIIKMVSILEERIGKKAKLEYLPLQKGDPIDTCADISYSHKKLNFVPQITFDKGIASVVTWFKEFYNV